MKKYNLKIADFALELFEKHLNFLSQVSETAANNLSDAIYEKLEDIPNVGDAYVYKSLTFKVTSVENRRIMRVMVEYKEVEEE